MPRRLALVAVVSLLVPAVCFAAARKRGDIPSSTNGIGDASECTFVAGNPPSPLLARFDGHTTVGLCYDSNNQNGAHITYADHSVTLVDNSNFAITITPIAWMNGGAGAVFTVLEVRFTVKSTSMLTTPSLRTIAFAGTQSLSFVPCNNPSPNGFNSSGFATGNRFYVFENSTQIFACMSSPVLAIPLVDGTIRTQYDGGTEIYTQEPDIVYDQTNNITVIDFSTLSAATGSDAVADIEVSGVPAAILGDTNSILEQWGYPDAVANGFDYSSAGLHYVVVDGSGTRYEGGSVSMPFPNCTIQGSGCQAPANDSVNSPTNIATASFQDNIDVSNATPQKSTDPITDPASGCYDATDGNTSFSNNGQFTAYRSVWYTVTAQNAGAISINTSGSRYDTRVDVYSGKPSSSSQKVVCDDDFTSNNVAQQQAKISGYSLPAKGTYYIMVSETAKPTGSVVEANGDLNPVAGPPFDTGTIPLAANAMLNLSVTATGLSGDKSSLSFAAQRVSTTSSALSVNVSAANGSVGTISPQVTGDFAISSNGCTSTLNINASCGIQVTFKPTADGSRSGTLTIGSDAVIGPLTIGLSGNGYVPQATFNTKTLTFSSQSLESTSAVQKVTITNGGDGPLTIGSFTSSAALAPFAYTTTCGASVAASSSCEFDFTFKPTSLGTASASLTINDDAPSTGSSQTVMLSGTGVPLTVAPSRPGRTTRSSGSPAGPLTNIRFGLALKLLDGSTAEQSRALVSDSRMRIPAKLPIAMRPVIVLHNVSGLEARPKAKPLSASQAVHRNKMIVSKKSK